MKCISDQLPQILSGTASLRSGGVVAEVPFLLPLAPRIGDEM